MTVARSTYQLAAQKNTTRIPGVYYLDEISPEQVLEHGKRFWIDGKEYAIKR